MERVTMPQLGETVTEGTITRWIKQVGDAVEVDDALFEVSTDKVETEVPSAVPGVLRQILVPEGDTVPIGTPLAVITATADEPLDDVPAVAPAPVTAPPEVDGLPPRAAAGGPGRRGVGLAERAPARRPQAPAAGAAHTSFLSPVVRALLAEHGLDPSEVVGSGRDGRITRADVLAVVANPPPPALPAPPAPAGPPPGPGPALGGAVPSAGADDDVVEFTRARRATAEHMRRSLATSAHTLVVTECDYRAVEPVRVAAGLSYLPFVARAVIDAIGAFPNVNASVGDDELIVHRRIHLGISVDLDFEALVVPVVHDAQDKRLRAIAAEIADLAARARAKRLGTDELTGGTFTLTTVGRYGTVVTAPVINQPQVAIVSVDGVRMRPVAEPDGAGGWAVTVHPIGNLCLSFDHRAYDGAYAAAFLARVRDIIETRNWSGEVTP